MRGALLLFAALMGCGTSEPAPATTTADATTDTHDAAVDTPPHDTTPGAYDSADPPEYPDTELGPIGHCLYDSIDWTCRAGHICTIFGKCTPGDAGPSEAGSEPCGLVYCDKEYCRCRTASVSLCDCN
jgi:hypothetical protein